MSLANTDGMLGLYQVYRALKRLVKTYSGGLGTCKVSFIDSKAVCGSPPMTWRQDTSPLQENIGLMLLPRRVGSTAGVREVEVRTNVSRIRKYGSSVVFALRILKTVIRAVGERKSGK